MRIGYPCLNRSIGCTASRTFRLASYSPQRFSETVQQNLECLEKTLAYNKKHNLLYFRISSDLIPFASHPVCTEKWEKTFAADFRRIGRYTRAHNFRITFHPDQFVVLNSPRPDVVSRSIAELRYHAAMLDAMELPLTARIQIHVGGGYGDIPAARDQFIEVYKKLPSPVKRRLCIENDDRLFSLKDCLYISRRCGVPVLFDNFHHACLNNKESVPAALASAAQTWNSRSGPLLVDYSSQQANSRQGSHAQHIDPKDFRKFCAHLSGINCDIMLEIKDKEKSAHHALSIAQKLSLPIQTAPNVS